MYKMTRVTRAASRRVKSPKSSESENTSSRTRRRANQPIIILSSDSEDEVFTQITHPVTPRKTKKSIEFNEISPVTPPKQKKIERDLFKTPKKNKTENDENFNTAPQTPSTLLKKLVLTSPNNNKTNKLNDTITEEKLHNKKSLFKDNNCYQNARVALHSTFPTEMPGRHKELNELNDFISTNLAAKTSGALYVSGPPGTGKTASLNMVLQDEEIASQFKHVYVNCTSIKSSGSIYSRILKELNVKSKGRTEKDCLESINSYLKKHSKMILLVLDEIDQLESKNQSVLYTIFEWPAKPNSKIILVGIANALDLTDRILPRLQSRCELKPKLMHFAPYTKQQIVEIFKSRLKQAGVEDVFSPIALQMLAGKVAAISGDVRRALDIGRRVIELIDRNRNCDVLKPIENLASELIENENNENHIKKQTEDNGKKTVELKQVVDVLNNVYSTTQNLTEENEDTFPLQQKIVLCSLVLMLKKAKNKDVTVGKLHEVYKKVCSKRNLLGVDQGEFFGLCSLIETRGIIKVSGKKETRCRKVNLEWDEDEVSNALKDKQLMSSILLDTDSLGKF